MPKFQKGHPRLGGRKKGMPTRGQVEIQQLARYLLSDPVYLANLRKRLVSGKGAPLVEAKLYVGDKAQQGETEEKLKKLGKKP